MLHNKTSQKVSTKKEKAFVIPFPHFLLQYFDIVLV